jgi:hypothetical protein
MKIMRWPATNYILGQGEGWLVLNQQDQKLGVRFQEEACSRPEKRSRALRIRVLKGTNRSLRAEADRRRDGPE